MRKSAIYRMGRRCRSRGASPVASSGYITRLWLNIAALSATIDVITGVRGASGREWPALDAGLRSVESRSSASASAAELPWSRGSRRGTGSDRQARLCPADQSDLLFSEQSAVRRAYRQIRRPPSGRPQRLSADIGSHSCGSTALPPHTRQMLR